MCGADEKVGQAEEEGEEGEGGGVGGGGRGGGEAEGEVRAFAGGGFIESGGEGGLVGGAMELVRRGQGEGTYFSGLSSGWSVTIRCSKASPACSIALISSGVRSVSVTSALSLMTVTQEGSRGWSLVLVRDMS